MENNWLPMPRYKLRKDLVKRILKEESPEGKTCLELGYGAGDMLLLCARFGMDVFGYDFSDEAFRMAQLRINENLPLCENITLLRQETEIGSRRYDYIMAFEVLEHIEKDAARLREWWNLLSDDGRLLISVPAHKAKWGANDIASGHLRRYEKTELTDLLDQSGFKVVRFWNYAYPISVLLDIYLHRKSSSGS